MLTQLTLSLPLTSYVGNYCLKFTFRVNMQSRPEYSVITNQTLHNFFVNSSHVSVINVSCCFLNIYTECSKCPPAAATHDQSL